MKYARSLTQTAATLSLVVVGAALPAPASALSPSCSYNPFAAQLVVVGTPAVVRRSGDDLTLNYNTCAGATITNTASIKLKGGADDNQFTIDLSGGAFAPGMGTEAGLPEIEFLVESGGGTDTLQIDGSAGADRVTAGLAGYALNPDTDADIVYAGATGYYNRVILRGRGGNDWLSAMGGYGTGAPAAADSVGPPVDLIGGDGDDIMLPGLKVHEVVAGESGMDTVDYSTRPSAVNVRVNGVYDDGYPGEQDNVTFVDAVVGTPYNDLLVGDGNAQTFRPLGGNDIVVGGAGDDTFMAMPYGDGSDLFRGGIGFGDAVSYGPRRAAVQVSLDGVANDGGDGELDDIRDDVEVMHGGAGGDMLVGSVGPQTMHGNYGDDTLAGGTGIDYYYGGAGNDTMSAVDGLGEAVDGGDGIDHAIADAFDNLFHVESSETPA